MIKLNQFLFDWSLWRSGTLLELFNISNRTYSLINNKHILRKYAIGWTPSERLTCRPKSNCKAVMFFINENYFWTHIKNNEFDIIWKTGD